MSSKQRERAEARAAVFEHFGWPQILTTSRAVEYSGWSRWTLYRAVAAGELVVAGRRGRMLMFRRDDIDRWMIGPSAEPGPRPAPKRTRPARASTETTTMRLRALKKLSVN